MKIKFKGQEMEIPEGATFKVVGGDLVVSPEDTEFKDGTLGNTCVCSRDYNSLSCHKYTKNFGSLQNI